jgi:YegS/Rv2252/BmrU family lipid kinase
VALLCSLIINPVSGGYAGRKLGRITAAFAAGGLDAEVLLTQSAADAELFARRICAERKDPLIIVGGGDGTINQVLNGVVPGEATLGVLPLGTANVLARELGIHSLEDAVQRVLRRVTRPLTTGLLEAEGVRRRFLLMAGIGVDGSIVAGVRDTEKRLFGKGAYLLAAARLMFGWEQDRLQVVADGRRIDCHSVIVCNAARYGGSFRLAPGADLFTPEFRVVCVTGDRRKDYLRLARAVIEGKVTECRGVELISAREVKVAGTSAVQVDGDFCCHAPVRITAQENFARLII